MRRSFALSSSTFFSQAADHVRAGHDGQGPEGPPHHLPPRHHELADAHLGQGEHRVEMSYYRVTHLIGKNLPLT